MYSEVTAMIDNENTLIVRLDLLFFSASKPFTAIKSFNVYINVPLFLICDLFRCGTLHCQLSKKILAYITRLKCWSTKSWLVYLSNAKVIKFTNLYISIQ